MFSPGIWNKVMDAIIATHDGKVQMLDSSSSGTSPTRDDFSLHNYLAFAMLAAVRLSLRFYETRAQNPKFQEIAVRLEKVFGMP